MNFPQVRSHGRKFRGSACYMRNLRRDYHALGFNQQKSKLSSAQTQNSYVRWHGQHYLTVITEDDAFKLCSDIHTHKGVRKEGFGANPPLEFSMLQKRHTYAKEFVYVFVHFLLVWCQLNAKTTEWFCIKISRNTVNGPKRSNYILVGIWVIACIQEPSHHFLQTSRRLRIFMLVLRGSSLYSINCLYFVRSARALTVLAWLLYQLQWHDRTS